MGINGRPQTIIVGTIIVGTMLKKGLWYMETKGPPPWKQKEDHGNKRTTSVETKGGPLGLL